MGYQALNIGHREAALSAEAIAAGGIPGYGPTRDAYCADGPSGD